MAQKSIWLQKKATVEEARSSCNSLAKKKKRGHDDEFELAVMQECGSSVDRIAVTSLLLFFFSKIVMDLLGVQHCPVGVSI